MTAPTLTLDQQRDAVMGRLLENLTGAFAIFSVYLGDQLGWYRALAEAGPQTPAGLAARTATHARYAREWLEQQVVAGLLAVENPAASAADRRFYLPPGHVEPLTDRDSLNYLAPLAQLLVGVVRPLPQLLEAYRTGGGVRFAAYGHDLRQGQADINRPAFLHQLAQEWLPALPDVHARLLADPPARVADFGCGFGWSSIGLARGYPHARVDGFDLDEPSIAHAQGLARDYGLTDRVRFQVRDAGDPALTGQYDLVTAFECVHDLADPVNALRTMRRLTAPGGTVLVVDERVGDDFTPQGNDVEGIMYGWSILHCLPVGLADAPAAGTGTVMRASTLRAYAQEAGFSQVEVLPIENFFFQFYRLTP